MFCPKCRTEYNEGITVCADCGAQLVVELPALEPEISELVTVLSTGDLSSVALAKSILEEAEISFIAKGEFGMEQLAVGPVEIQVDRKDHKQARKLLMALAEGRSVDDLLDPPPPDEGE
jgi:hypothetical protein